jgi:hypothetical protein
MMLDRAWAAAQEARAFGAGGDPAAGSSTLRELGVATVLFVQFRKSCAVPFARGLNTA